jgi:hypothetical protein
VSNISNVPKNNNKIGNNQITKVNHPNNNKNNVTNNNNSNSNNNNSNRNNITNNNINTNISNNADYLIVPTATNIPTLTPLPHPSLNITMG